jgi:TIR domain
VEVFISWSGEPSKRAAVLLKELLESIMQNTKVWLSTDSIGSGEVWIAELKEALSEINFGIAMLSRANINSPFLLFEAGSLSKKTEGRLVPVLCDLRPIDVKGPFQHFQQRFPNQDDIWIHINSLAELTLEDERLKKAFDKWWPDFDEGFRKIDFKEEQAVMSEPETPDKRLARIEDALDQLLKSSVSSDQLLQALAKAVVQLSKGASATPSSAYGNLGLLGNMLSVGGPLSTPPPPPPPQAGLGLGLAGPNEKGLGLGIGLPFETIVEGPPAVQHSGKGAPKKEK